LRKGKCWRESKIAGWLPQPLALKVTPKILLMMKIKVFISYSHEEIDTSIAYKIYNKLDSISYIEPWFDKVSLRPGENWRNAIENAIKESRFFIALLSTRSVSKNGYFQKELKDAIGILETFSEEKIFIIPIRLDECVIPIKLKDIHCVSWFPNEDETMEKIMGVLNQGYEYYLGRIDRTKHIIKSIKSISNECNKNNETVCIRLRAAFTSMSNMIHYGGKEVPDLNLDQQKELDNLLIEERNSFISLLNMDNVKLKCIIWPKLRFLDYYTEEEKRERYSLLKSFLIDSLNKYVINRRILCDETGSHGNLILIGNKEAIISNPQSGGYTKTSTFNKPDIIDVLINEYDIMFNSILKRKSDLLEVESDKEQNKSMILSCIDILNREMANL